MKGLTQKILFLFFSALLLSPAFGAKDRCGEDLGRLGGAPARTAKSGITADDLTRHVSDMIGRVPEFEYIREEASRQGLRVWLFGGTASSFLHYAKWDLAREKGLLDLQKDRFDYDFTNIFRSTQDLDIVVDAKPEVAREFQNRIAQRFPHFLGSKANKWEVRTLRHRMGSPGQPGFKEALLNDTDFNNQNTDSNSVAMVELTRGKEPVIRDLRHWDEGKSHFLDDALSNRISFFRSPKHFTTSRAKAGENPEILSVIRLLVKAFQYQLEFSPEDFRLMKEVVDGFDPRKVNNPNAIRRIQDTAKKLVQHATNIEYAMNVLDELGLRKKLIAMGNHSSEGDQAWWLNKEPLRTRTVGEGRGKTAEELNIKVVAHETNNFLAYESITRAHSGEPNVLISRQNAVGEAAAHGDGFYTRLGKEGARGTGLTIRFTVDPKAREGTDFTVHGDYIVFKNKKALKVIQESLNFGLDDLLKLAEENKDVQVDHSDLALLEKLKRKLNAARINDELEKLLNSKSEADHDRLVHILSAFQNPTIERLISKETLSSVAKNVLVQVSPLKDSSKEQDILRYIKTVGPILRTLDSGGVLKEKEFSKYLDKVIESGAHGWNLRKEAIFEKLLSSDDFEMHLRGFQKGLSEDELNRVVSEIKGWHKSADNRQKRFSVELDTRWHNSIERGEIKTLKELIGSRLFDANHKSISGFSALLLADYYNQKNVIDWLIENPDFDFNQKNARGDTEVEQLRLLGKDKLADEIVKRRRDVKARMVVQSEEPRMPLEPAQEAPSLSPIQEEKSKAIQIPDGKSVVQLLSNGTLQDLGFRAPPDGITYKEGWLDGEGNVLVLLGGTGQGFNVKLKGGPVIISRLQQWEKGINPDVTQALPNLNGSGFTVLDKQGAIYRIELPTRQKREFTAHLIDKGPFSRLFQHEGANFAESKESGGVVEVKDKPGQFPELVKTERDKLFPKKVAPQAKSKAPAAKEHLAGEIPKERANIVVKERNADGSPIIDFVRFEPGSFLMGDGEGKRLTTLTKPFEMMSTPTTQKTYKTVVELLKARSLPKYKELNPIPSYFKGEQNPVEQVSFSDIELWNQGLNELSKLDDAKVQKTLEALFPGHKRGDEYRLPTEAEWEFVARNAGLAEGNYSFGNSETDLSDHAWFYSNSGNKTHPVGLKKPVFYNGKPIYDLHGNVWEWIQDWYGNNLSGGTDPQGPVAGSGRVIRGGGWNAGAQLLGSASRYYYGPGGRNFGFGFRLVRTPK